jgi:hypothetical protein
VVEQKEKYQTARPGIAESLILCCLQAYKTHSKSIDVLVPNDDQALVPREWYIDKGSKINMTCFESGM